MENYKICHDIEKSIFRTYDIRGVVDKTLTVDGVYSIGRAIGSAAYEKGQRQVIVGRDGRLSGPKLLAALAAGLLDSGCNVINLGEVTTPVLYYATNVLSSQSGVMLTGSHNPPGYNGIKIVLDGVTICEDAILDLHKRIVDNNFLSGRGNEQQFDILKEYIERITSSVKLARPLKVVIDCGNGVGGKIAPIVFDRLGCEVIPLFCEVDGTFPNHHPDPAIADNLQDLIAKVKSTNADIGLAFDGDADRLGVVTDKGEIIWPDRFLIMLVRDVLARNPGAAIPFDVKCTQHLAKEILKAGGAPKMGRTGHALIKARMKKLAAPIGGELSGHIFIKERWYGFDDGIYAGARLLEILAQAEGSCSDMFATIPDSVNTPELKLPMDDDLKYDFMNKFIARAIFPGAEVTSIDGIRIDFNDGFGLMRPSNTTPNIVLRFEGENETALTRIKDAFKQKLLAIDKDLELPF
ncbi:MAG: phosphomannomutase/phosphoglucomutase [Gammaproteobacteria bacterium]|nr:phosphomannomutase/phosphoglucomutase [Gammaproteobacteria bacterium]